MDFNPLEGPVWPLDSFCFAAPPAYLTFGQEGSKSWRVPRRIQLSLGLLGKGIRFSGLEFLTVPASQPSKPSSKLHSRSDQFG